MGYKCTQFILTYSELSILGKSISILNIGLGKFSSTKTKNGLSYSGFVLRFKCSIFRRFTVFIAFILRFNQYLPILGVTMAKLNLSFSRTESKSNVKNNLFKRFSFNHADRTLSVSSILPTVKCSTSIRLSSDNSSSQSFRSYSSRNTNSTCSNCGSFATMV